jgi:hypothetical protein
MTTINIDGKLDERLLAVAAAVGRDPIDVARDVLRIYLGSYHKYCEVTNPLCVNELPPEVAMGQVAC